MKRLFPLLAAALLVLPGCFNIEIGLDLGEDHSGTAQMAFGYDLESMVYVMAALAKSFEGEEGAPSEEELATAREELLADMDADDDPFDEAEARAEIEKDLPEGVRLLDVSYVDEGLKGNYSFRVAFDELQKLSQVRLSPGEEQADPEAGGGMGSPEDALETPFAGLQVIDEGATWLVTTPPVEPTEQARQQAGMEGMEQMAGMVAKAFENFKFDFWIQVPGEVVDHNATRVEGRKLTWEWNFESISEADQGGITPSMFVRYRK